MMNFSPQPPKFKLPHRHLVILLAVAASSVFFTIWATAGTLTPSSSPGATMKTLQEIYDSITGTSFDSSGISADQNGSLIEGLKYINANLSWASSSNDIYMTSSGNVGIGDSTPGLLTHIRSSSDTDILRLQDSDGTCDHNPEAGSETVTCSSDQRLKENIVDAPSVLSDLAKFRIREFNVISSDDRMLGVVAQEVQSIFPDLVSSRSNGYLAVEQPTTWQLVKGLQEVDILTKALETKILALPSPTPQLPAPALNSWT